jgi:hypothetical protein
MSMCMPKWELIHVSILLEQDNKKAKTPTASNAGDTRACQAKTRHHKDRHAVIEDTLQHGSRFMGIIMHASFQMSHWQATADSEVVSSWLPTRMAGDSHEIHLLVSL